VGLGHAIVVGVRDQAKADLMESSQDVHLDGKPNHILLRLFKEKSQDSLKNLVNSVLKWSSF
jgi:hypothetical protein